MARPNQQPLRSSATKASTKGRTSGLSMLVRDTRGANLVEYIILVGVIALIAIAGFKVFGGKVRSKIDQQAGSVGGSTVARSGRPQRYRARCCGCSPA